MTTHTPGLWLEDHTAEPEIMAKCLLDNPTWIAIEDTADDGGHVAYCAPANAPLIAAAPDMLAALKLAEQRIAELALTVCVLAGNPKKVRAADYSEEISAAITKAEGRAP